MGTLPRERGRHVTLERLEITCCCQTVSLGLLPPASFCTQETAQEIFARRTLSFVDFLTGHAKEEHPTLADSGLISSTNGLKLDVSRDCACGLSRALPRQLRILHRHWLDKI
jgi:hypothetical protein